MTRTKKQVVSFLLTALCIIISAIITFIAFMICSAMLFRNEMVAMAIGALFFALSLGRLGAADFVDSDKYHYLFPVMGWAVKRV